MWERFKKFVRTHWAASSAVLLAVLAAAAVIVTAIVFPPALLAIAGVTIFGFTPLTFLATLSAPLAIPAAGAIAFGVVTAASAVFNAVVGVYNWLDKKITPSGQQKGLTLYMDYDLEDAPKKSGLWQSIKNFFSRNSDQTEETLKAGSNVAKRLNVVGDSSKRKIGELPFSSFEEEEEEEEEQEEDKKVAVKTPTPPSSPKLVFSGLTPAATTSEPVVEKQEEESSSSHSI